MNQHARNRQTELDAFKELNLSVIASNFGYRMVKNKSTRHSVLMESSNDKIIVSRNGRHYVYCSVFDHRSNGTVIDFAQQVIEPGATLGRVRQLLRPFLDVSHFSNVQKQHVGHFAKSICPSSTDFTAVAARYSQFEPITSHHRYLCTERKIPLELLRTDRLKGRVKHCPRRGSIIFPHWGWPNDQERGDRMVTGYEIKGPGINLFSKAGRKGLWSSAGFPGDTTLVVTESGLDGLSYLALHETKAIRVVSISGQLNSYQPDLIKSAIAHMGKEIEVVAAVDNDEGGDRLLDQLSLVVRGLGRDDICFRPDRPLIRGADWNDQLRKAARFSSITCPSIP